MEHPEFVQALTTWYLANKRNLPWRAEKSPYFIYLSEVLLQQTRVNQGLPYYHKFTNEFPNITSLAKASEDKVLRLWQGLGYYSRARNLHETAKFIVNNLNGNFPETYSEILKLKGVGEYTAAAIASFAFDEKVAVLDGNVFRVLSRVFGVYDDILSSKGKKIFKAIAQSLIPEDNPATYNQAIMEFGALQCTPGKPDCSVCPCSHFCFARINKSQTDLPVKIKKTSKKERKFQYLVFSYEDKILMNKRKGNDIWKGLYEFPMEETTGYLASESPENYQRSKTYKHVLSHQVIEANFIRINISGENQLKLLAGKTNSEVVTVKDSESLPKPVLINNYLKEYIF